MSDACTIYGSKVDYLAVYNIVRGMSSAPVEVTGDVHDWQKLQVSCGSTITLDSMRRQEKPEFNEFSKLILGTYAFFQHIKGPPEVIERRGRVLGAISNCQFALGVVAFPEFSETDKHFEIILAITAALDGLIFNGSGMVDQKGLLVLDNDGDFDAA